MADTTVDLDTLRAVFPKIFQSFEDTPAWLILGEYVSPVRPSARACVAPRPPRPALAAALEATGMDEPKAIRNLRAKQKAARKPRLHSALAGYADARRPPPAARTGRQGSGPRRVRGRAQRAPRLHREARERRRARAAADERGGSPFPVSLPPRLDLTASPSACPPTPAPWASAHTRPTPSPPPPPRFCTRPLPPRCRRLTPPTARHRPSQPATARPARPARPARSRRRRRRQRGGAPCRRGSSPSRWPRRSRPTSR